MLNISPTPHQYTWLTNQMLPGVLSVKNQTPGTVNPIILFSAEVVETDGQNRSRKHMSDDTLKGIIVVVFT